jgi:hypothetical protein
MSVHISEEHVLSIFRVEAKQESSVQQLATIALLDVCFTPLSCLAYSSTEDGGDMFVRNVC